MKLQLNSSQDPETLRSFNAPQRWSSEPSALNSSFTPLNAELAEPSKAGTLSFGVSVKFAGEKMAKGNKDFFLKSSFWHFPPGCNSTNANHQFGLETRNIFKDDFLLDGYTTMWHNNTYHGYAWKLLQTQPHSIGEFDAKEFLQGTNVKPPRGSNNLLGAFYLISIKQHS